MEVSQLQNGKIESNTYFFLDYDEFYNVDNRFDVILSKRPEIMKDFVDTPKKVKEIFHNDYAFMLI